jgi:Zn ribbon nucleic-acid-binding protein
VTPLDLLGREGDEVEALDQRDDMCQGKRVPGGDPNARALVAHFAELDRHGVGDVMTIRNAVTPQMTQRSFRLIFRHLARVECPECGHRELTQPPGATVGFGAWEVECVHCGYRDFQSLSSGLEAAEEGYPMSGPPSKDGV